MMGKLGLRSVCDSVLCPVLIFTVVTLAVTHPILKDFNNSGFYDWIYHQFINAVPRKTILEYHQIPLWNPYARGGIPIIANPESTFFSPMFIFVLFFGVIHGLKIEIIIHTILGMYGAYQLSRYLGMDRVSSYLPSFIFMLSGGYIRHIIFGQHTWFAVAWVPWCFLYYLKSMEYRRYAIISALFLSLICLQGVVVFVYFIIFFIIYSILKGFQKKHFGYIINAVLVLALCMMFSSIKAFSTIKIHLETKEVRGLGQSIPPTLDGFLHFTLDKSVDGPIDGHWYIGGLPLILCFLGVVICFKERWPLIFATLIMTLFSLGPYSPFGISNMLHSLPFYIAVRNISRIMITSYFGISLLAGFAVNSLRKKHRFIPIALIIIILLDYLVVDIQHFEIPFHIKIYDTYNKDSGFHHISYCINDCIWDGYFSLYDHFIENKGVLNAAYPIAVPANPIPKFINGQINPVYEGEVFLAGDNGMANLTFFSINRFEADVVVFDDDILILNQNFRDGWRVRGSSGPAEPLGGLVSTRVSPGDGHVVFYYLPTEFIVGAIITFFSLLASILYYFRFSIYGGQKNNLGGRGS